LKMLDCAGKQGGTKNPAAGRDGWIALFGTGIRCGTGQR